MSLHTLDLKNLETEAIEMMVVFQNQLHLNASQPFFRIARPILTNILLRVVREKILYACASFW